MVRLIQLMCDNRHTALAMAYLEEEASEAQARHDLAVYTVDLMGGLPVCELCGSAEWHFEDGLTSFRSLEEAKPVLDEHTRRLVMSRKMFSRAVSLN